MKAILLSLFLVAISLGQLSSASETISSSTDESIRILDYVVDVHRTYSNAAGVQAKVVEILGGDGMNPTRMILLLDTGYEDTKIFELGVMMYSVKRIVFLSVDKIVINYVQDDVKNTDDMEPVQKNRSVTIQFFRNADGTIADKIKID